MLLRRSSRSSRSNRPLLFAALIVLLMAGAVRGEGWGHLTGRFVFDGPVPVRKPHVLTADKAFCSKHAPLDETLIVNKENKGLQNLVVFVYTKTGEEVPIHEDLQDLADEDVVLDNSRCAFSPHVQTMWYKQPLVIKNTDAVAHNSNVKFLDPRNKAFNVQIPAGGKYVKKLAVSERIQTEIGCNAHPWMKSWLWVRPNPYATVTDKDGKFTIEYLPEGEWTFQFWHENWGYVSAVRIKGKQVSWTRGRAPLKIADDKTTNLGTISVNPKDYAD